RGEREKEREREREKNSENLHRGGGGSRTYRRAFPAANESRTLFDDLATLHGAGHLCRFERLLSDIRWDGDQSYPFTTRCYEFKLNVSPPTPWLCLAAVRA